jgi:hypothetical protein
MSKTKVILAAFIAIIALSAVAASSASAAWKVNGKALAAGEKVALSTKAIVDEQAVLNVPTLSLKISCAGLSGVKPEIEGTTKASAEHLIFEGCSEIEPKTCKLNPTTVKTEPITATTTTGVSPDDKVLFKPTVAGPFATLVFEGTCSLAGEKPVTGAVVVNAPTGQSEEVSQLIDGIGSAEGNNSLEVAKNKAFIEGGKALLKTANGSKWSFR